MLPEIFFWGLPISTYYLMMFFGFVFMMVLMVHRRAIYHLSILQSIMFTVCLMISSLAGCKVLYILENLSEVVENGVTWSGFSFFGAVFLVPPLMAIFGLFFRLTPQESINASAPCGNAMIGSIRIGCFLNGCCGGWVNASGFRWPTQAIESIGDFIILFFLLQMEKKGNHHIYALFMLCYSALRFPIEFMRDTPKDWFGLSHGQWFAIAAAIVAGIILVPRTKRGLKHE